MLGHLFDFNRMGLIQTPDQLKFSYLSIMEVPWILSFSFLLLFVGSQAAGSDRLYSRLWGTCCWGKYIQEERYGSNIYLMLLNTKAKNYLKWKIPTMKCWLNQASDSDSEEEVPPPLPPPRTESLKKEVTTVCSSIKVASWRNQFDQSPSGGYGWRQCSNHHRCRAVQFRRLQFQSGPFTGLTVSENPPLLQFVKK